MTRPAGPVRIFMFFLTGRIGSGPVRSGQGFSNKTRTDRVWSPFLALTDPTRSLLIWPDPT